MDPDNSEVRRTVLSVLEECGKCQRSYELEDARIVGRNGNLWVLTVTCPMCQTQAFVAAVVGDETDEDVVTVEPDITHELPDDTESPLVSVSVDDVLDMHEFLETFDGNFMSLFARRSR